jgi:hypothetical protein
MRSPSKVGLKSDLNYSNLNKIEIMIVKIKNCQADRYMRDGGLIQERTGVSLQGFEGREMIVVGLAIENQQ